MKLFLRILAVLAVLVVVLITALHLYLTDERLKGLVMPPLNEALGRDVQVDRISFTLLRTFPNFGLVLQGFVLADEDAAAGTVSAATSDPAGAASAGTSTVNGATTASVGETSAPRTLARFDELLVSVNLLPLLSNEIQVRRLDLIRPDLTYRVRADGTTNIDFLFPEADAASDTIPAGAGPVIDLNRIRVVDANIRYEDAVSGISAVLRDLDLTMSVRLSDLIETDIDAQLAGLTVDIDGARMVNDLALQLRQTSALDLDAEQLDITQGVFSIRGLALDVTGQIAAWSQPKMQLDLSFSSSSDNFGALLELVPDAYRSYVAGIQTRGKLDISAEITGELGESVVPEFLVQLSVQEGYLKHPQASEPVESVEIRVRADNSAVLIEQFRARAAGNNVSMSGRLGAPLSDNPVFDFSADVRMDLATVSRFYPIAEFGVDALRGQFTLVAQAVGTVQDAENASINADLTLDDGFIRYAGAPQPVEAISVRMNATQQAVRIDAFSARAAGNRVSLSGTVTSPLDEARTAFDLRADARLDLATIKDFYPIDEDTLRMRGNFSFDGSARGTLAAPDQSRIEGTLTLADGYVAHRDLAYPIEDIALNGRLSGTTFQLAEARLRSGDNTISGSGNIRNYMRGTPELDLRFRAAINLDQIDAYYSLSELQMTLGGRATADLALRGPIDDFDRIRFNGGVQLTGFNMTSPDLPQPITATSGNLTFSESDVRLQQFTMMLGSSDFALEGSLTNWRNLMEAPGGATAPAMLTATYASRMLNVDEIVDWEEESDEPLIVELPNLRSQLTARIDTLIMMGIPVYAINGRMETDPKTIRMTEGRATLYDGSVIGRFTWDITRPDYTNVHFVGNLDNVRAESFFAEFQMGVPGKFHQYISGGLSAATDYRAGMTAMLDQDTPTILASGTFGIARARLRNHPSQVAIADLLGIAELKDLSMDTWTARYAIRDGVLSLTDMNLTSRDIGLTMNGNQYLIEDRLDYKIRLRLPERYADQLARVITADAVEALKSGDGIIVVPLVLVGSSENPRVTVDREVVQQLVTEYLRRRGTEGVEDAARRLIRGLQRN